MTRVIINADDFGLSPGVTRGIVAAFREGVLTSTTMLVNLKSFDDAVQMALQNRDLPVGIHLSLLWGAPVSDPARVRSLIERDGQFPRSLSVVARRYFLGGLNLDHVREEFRAQVAKFRGTGLTPSHVDTHKHVHCLPGVFEALADVANEAGIHCVRLPREQRLVSAGVNHAPSISVKSLIKTQIVGVLSRNGRAVLQNHRLKSTDHFVGITYQDCLDAKTLAFLLSHLRDGVTEIMCHPGYDDPLAREYSRTPPHRERELAALRDADVKECFVRRGIQPISYNDL